MTERRRGPSEEKSSNGNAGCPERLPITAVVITENEEERIEACLRSLRFCAEILVVDGGSVDRTVERARPFADRIIEHSASEVGLNGNKNLGAEEARHEWILSVDADEIVPLELADEIRDVLKDPQYDGYEVARRTYLLDCWIRSCGWWPGYVVRLYRKEKVSWPPGVHETPSVPGGAGRLKTPLEHYSFPSIGLYLRKLDHFTRCEAREKWERGERLTAGNAPWHLFFKPMIVFVKKYLFQRGFFDGLAGFFVSVSAALAVFFNYIRLWEIQRTGKIPSQGGRGRSDG
ncbi:MAG: glycosyltransferase family 2 protein [Candidatus Hydrogenedentota bacterium]|nr:MAG: glycosyltransferase family 2 protein [Candidatus Hydrogenedentota bacterium]